MRWLLSTLIALTLLGCPPKDVPDPPAVGASAKDGQKVRQPPPPAAMPTPSSSAAPSPAAPEVRSDGADAETRADAEAEDDTNR